MFENGSEWRRWDLHIHTPETKENDQYTGSTPEEKWELFYQAIDRYIGDGSEPTHNIVAIGITDYVSIDNYRKVIEDKRLPNSVKLVLPNVEMRAAISAKKSTVNLHFIFDPEIVDELDDQFFSKLQMKLVGDVVSASRGDLKRLGRMMTEQALDDETALLKGIERFRPPLDSIIDLFQQNKNLRNHVLIGVSNGSNDGASGINDSLIAVRRALYHMADFIFSGNPSDRKYFLGKKESDSPEAIKQKYGSIKPCIHGCDAHSVERIFEPDKKRYCWIKADPSFNGLKQILCEPESRVWIGPERPEEKSSYQVIDSVKFNDERFSPNPIVFNEELNCIIGGKSTGKSLLLHNIARTVDKKQVNEKINACGLKETLELPNMEIVWKDGKIDKIDEDNQHKISYIPQTYLNRLSEEKENQTEIDNIIENVLHQNDDIRLAHETMNENIRQLKQKYTQLCLSIIENYEQIITSRNEIKELGNSDAIIIEIDKLKKKQREFEESNSLTNNDLENFQTIKFQINENKLCKENLNELSSYIADTVEILDKEKINNLKSKIDSSTEFSIELQDKIKGQIDKACETIESYSKQIWLSTISSVEALIQQEVSIIGKKITQQQFEFNKLEKIISSNDNLLKLNRRIAKEEENLNKVKTLEKKLDENKKIFSDSCENLAQAFDEFKEQHDNYANTVNQNQNLKSTGLVFEVQTFFKENQFHEEVEKIFDKRSLKSKKDIINLDSFTFENFTKEKRVKFIQGCVQNELKTVKNENTESALRSLFTDWFNTNYTVKMENDSLQEMSPGKKSLVLLELIISLADSKYPILIDQPEDDLDNRSIFKELIPFIKEKKKERQFIVVTHNANVVLGADAEEVIIANQDGENSPNENYKFEYLSGSIENDKPINQNSNGILKKSSIQQHICDVLEGGKDALELRTKKYRM